MLIIRTIFFFFFNDTATTEIYTLSLHDALPIYQRAFLLLLELLSHLLDAVLQDVVSQDHADFRPRREGFRQDRKSTRLNSSHGYISYAVFCLKKKKYTYASPTHTQRRPI